MGLGHLRGQHAILAAFPFQWQSSLSYHRSLGWQRLLYGITTAYLPSLLQLLANSDYHPGESNRILPPEAWNLE